MLVCIIRIVSENIFVDDIKEMPSTSSRVGKREIEETPEKEDGATDVEETVRPAKRLKKEIVIRDEEGNEIEETED